MAVNEAVPVNDAAPEILNAEQRARCAALRVARDVLAARSLISSNAVEPWQLTSVADWIIDGPTNEDTDDEPDKEEDDDDNEDDDEDNL